ncbi:uncharacterized protein LOC126676246 [Mercurialis annua]|uniref:uncharacterized protein LOC126676246 n=1 Tax=Mercurialis annua TaxID=3986 RepID=UPI00215FD5BD|nr:uncharacterized protein LOC126676246 [Mercurialis annua]
MENSIEKTNNPTKFYTHFLYKALIVSIFLVILPLFPSQAPEFINHTLNTRGWEFLHLVFVGIAISYGLFSRKNDETDKDYTNSNTHSSKFDNAQSYVSKFLQVSSVFDDDSDSTPLSKSDGSIRNSNSSSNSSSVQTWNNQYYRNDPVVAVLDQEQRSGVISRIGEKPLLLPVRSLKSRVLDTDGDEIRNESSNFGSKRFLKEEAMSRNGEFGLNFQDVEEKKKKDNVVLPSPIPWRSRSGRLEMKENKQETENPSLYNPSPNLSPKPDNRTSSANLSPSGKKFSPSSSFSAETQGKSAEDHFVRKKSFYRSPPPPPPPPPPPTFVIRNSRSIRPNSTEIENDHNSLDSSLSIRANKSNEEQFDDMLDNHKASYAEKLVSESDDDLEETEDDFDEDDIARSRFIPREKEANSGDGGPDVDKKADEFIAKFREQIRLQRIESIKLSSGQIKRKASR